MFNELKPVAQALVTAHLARTSPDTVNMPTDIAPHIARAFCLGIECTIAREMDKAEEHFEVLQAAGIWKDAQQVVSYIQSLTLSANALHRHSKLAADTLQIRRNGDDLDDLAARMAAI